MKKISLLYGGSPDFSANFLEKIITDKTLPITVKLVLTAPDKPVGRKQILTPTPVKQIAKKYHLPITYSLKSQSSKNKTSWQNLKLNKEILDLSCQSNVYGEGFDIGLIYAYSSIIPKELLSVPRYGFWCIHPSLLPQYRGPSPIAYSLINGDKKTGVTIFKMDEKIDHGPLIAQQEQEILPTDHRLDLEKKLTDLAFSLFKKLILTDFSRHRLIPQPDSLATYTRLLKKEDGFIPLSILKKALKNEPLSFTNWPGLIKEFLIKYPNQKKLFFQKNPRSSLLIFNLFRGLYPWPGIWTILPNGKRLKITAMSLVNLTLATITKVQLEGKKEVDFTTFNRAYKIF